jgi:DNA modification methylase
MVNKSEYKRFTNVWTDIFELGFGTSPQKFSNFRNHHFTPKPTELAERIIKLHTKEGDTVLDCFMGSGFTGKACINLNRNFIGIEKDKDIFTNTEIDIKNLISEKNLEIV